MRRLTILAALLLWAAPILAQDDAIFRQNAAPGPYMPRGTPPTPAHQGAPLVAGTDSDSKRTLEWGPPPLSAVHDANDDPLDADPCTTLRLFELLEGSTPAAGQCGVNVADFPPTASEAHWQSQNIVTTSGAQNVAGVKNFTDDPTYDSNPGTPGWTIGPFTITGYQHNSGRKYFVLTGGAAVGTAANGESYSPLPCPKLRRLNVVSLDSSGVRRAQPSSNSMTFGFRVNATDGSTAQTVAASADNATGAPTWTTGWSELDRILLWGEGVGADTTANLQYRIWASCY